MSNLPTLAFKAIKCLLGAESDVSMPVTCSKSIW